MVRDTISLSSQRLGCRRAVTPRYSRDWKSIVARGKRMPFTKARYGTKAKFQKMKRCVKAVGTRGKVNPFAVCRASIYGKRKVK